MAKGHEIAQPNGSVDRELSLVLIKKKVKKRRKIIKNEAEERL